MGDFFRRLHYLIFRRRFDRELEAELRTHRDTLPVDERHNFGDFLRLREDARVAWGWMWIDRLLQDLAYSIRVLRTSPGFTIAAVLILALGTGANTSVFSILNAVVLRPLPYSDPSLLYQIEAQSTPVQGTQRSGAGSGRIDRSSIMTLWRQRTQVFESMTMVQTAACILGGVPEPEQLRGLQVDKDCFAMLGTPPLRGRWFTQDDFKPSASRTVIISYRVWQKDLGGDLNIIGKLVRLDGEVHQVIGIMPAEFQFSHGTDMFWIPVQEQSRASDTATFFARAKRGIGLQQVRVEVQMISNLLRNQHPTDTNFQLIATPIQTVVVGNSGQVLFVLLGAVSFVLLIACLNVANLVLSRGMERTKEIAVRNALGASRARVIRQLFTENILLAIVGGALGLLLAIWANKALIALFVQKNMLPRLEQTSVDARVLCFTALIALGSSVFFGLIPALQSKTIELTEALKATGTIRPLAIHSRRFRNLLITAETALSLVLLVGAGLMLESFYGMIHNAGFKSENVWTVRLPVPAYMIPRTDRMAYYTGILRQVRNLPDIESAALTFALPLSGSEIVVHSIKFPEAVPYRGVSPGYFHVMGIPLVEGRDFVEGDTQDAPEVAVVNEMLAHQLWPGQPPIGRMLGDWTVVGLVGNVKHHSLSAPAQAEIFVPYLQSLSGMPLSALAVRVRTNPIFAMAAIRRRIHTIQPDQPVEIAPMDQLLSDSVAQPRIYTLLLSIFAGLALLLATVGVYGVISYAVSQRRQEIGIRMALGAQRSDILKEFVRHGARHVLLGVVVGLAGALAAARLLSNLLYEVKPTDPAIYAIVSLILLTFALGAIFVPAWRATMTDPLSVLRNE